MNKKTTTLTLLIFMINLSFPVFGFELYDGKKVDIDMNILVGIDYSYVATLLPGRGGFELTNSRIKIEGDYLDNLKLSLSV